MKCKEFILYYVLDWLKKNIPIYYSRQTTNLSFLTWPRIRSLKFRPRQPHRKTWTWAKKTSRSGPNPRVGQGREPRHFLGSNISWNVLIRLSLYLCNKDDFVRYIVASKVNFRLTITCMYLLAHKLLIPNSIWMFKTLEVTWQLSVKLVMKSWSQITVCFCSAQQVLVPKLEKPPRSLRNYYFRLNDI